VNFSQLLTGWLLPASASTYGPKIDSIYYFILWVTGIFFVLTEVLLITFSIRYRRKEGRKALYSHGNTTLELIWTTVPALLLVYMGLASQTLWSQLRQPSQFPGEALQIKVMAEQWLWHFKYAGEDGQFDTDDDVNVDNNIHIPQDRPVKFEVHAQDVIHGFYIPALRVHQDTVPGIASTVWVQANKAGDYDIRCTQFCGTNHYEMKGQVTVESPDNFKTWLASTKESSF
jgi:cytochrome c oxidase subunit II